MRLLDHNMLILISSLISLSSVSLAYESTDSFLINCGSSSNTTVGNRVFLADEIYANVLSNPSAIFVDTNSNSPTPTFYSDLFQTARVLDRATSYTFPIKEHGWHWIRLYFFPVVEGNYSLSNGKFSVSAQNFTLLKEYQIESGYVVKEYSLNITSNNLVLTFTPSSNSFAFINALEVVSFPDDLIPKDVRTIDQKDFNPNLWNRAVETVYRVNMGNITVPPQDDTLSRLWVSDGTFLRHQNLVKFVSNPKAVNLSRWSQMEDIAPRSVYGTATKLLSESDDRIIANVTWHFDIDPGFEYLVRYHFCDIVSTTLGSLFFSVYVNSWLVDGNVDLSNLTSNTLGAPYFMDVITKVHGIRVLSISVGPSRLGNPYPNAILNGLEIKKISNSRGSLDEVDHDMNILKRSSKKKIGLIVGAAIGIFVSALVLSIIMLVLCRRRKKSAHIGKEEQGVNFGINGTDIKYPNGSTIFSNSKIGYRFPFVAIQEATDNFSENTVIGFGGFGKVYKGVLRDNTQIAVKRGASESQQGLAEFRTEIEMLSQFRHRHLVTLIGYCDEQKEMIIIYEYMEKGTLKDHLYGSDVPNLSWRQRLEICIGSARGLHYLHTGPAKAIIHRDVKSANILLDENYMAKVADFGLSKTGPEIDQTHVSTAVKGSFGYLDPEYLTRQQLTEKSDVYSFGVVLFEVLCGRTVIDPSLPRERVNLVDWAMKCVKNDRLEDIVDSRIANEVNPDLLRKFAEIAEKCLAKIGIDRPTMGDVLWNLECALQIQGNEISDQKEESSSQVNSTVNHWETSVSSTQLSMGSADGVSMSKVFAEMVLMEDMR